MSGQSDKDPEQAKVRQDLLLKVYGAALDECRFNVQLGWDRTKFYLTVSLTAIAAGVGLMRIADEAAIYFFLSLYFSLLFIITFSGSQTIQKSKQYYREAVRIKNLVERELGLLRQIDSLGEVPATLSIAVTPGQRTFLKMLFKHEERVNKKPDKGSIIQSIGWIFITIMLIEIAGVIISWFMAAKLAMK